MGKQYLGDEPKAVTAALRRHRLHPEVADVFARRRAPPETSIPNYADIGFDAPEIVMTRAFSERDTLVHVRCVCDRRDVSACVCISLCRIFCRRACVRACVRKRESVAERERERGQGNGEKGQGEGKR